MRQYIGKYIKGCTTCQQNKTVTHRNHLPLQPILLKKTATPFSTISMDFITKLPESKGSDTILTIMNQGCIKAVILLPCKESMRSIEIARKRLFYTLEYPK